MSFVTFSSRTHACSTTVSRIRMRPDKTFKTKDAKLIHAAIIDALIYFQAASSFEVLPTVKLIRKYMRRIGISATSIVIAKCLARIRLKDLAKRPSKGHASTSRNGTYSKGPTCPRRSRKRDNRTPLQKPNLSNSLPSDGAQTFGKDKKDSNDVFASSVSAASLTDEHSLATAQSSSMSRRRSSCNMPTLQRIIPLNHMPQYTHAFDGFKIPFTFPVHPCSTPITPLEKIIHTPEVPPALHQNGRQGSWSPFVGVGLASSSPQAYSPSTSPTMRVAGRVRVAIPHTSDRRRLSVVAPPEAPPMHAPRRLSYSKAFGLHNSGSPLSNRKASLSEGLACCPENELLASPLSIRSSTSTPQRPVLDTCGAQDTLSKDFPFTFAMSPRVTKV